MKELIGSLIALALFYVIIYQYESYILSQCDKNSSARLTLHHQEIICL